MARSEQDVKKVPRRERTKIFYDILYSIIRHESVDVARITRVQNDVNLPSDRLRAHLKEMSLLGLVEYGEALASTDKGRAFVNEYEKVVSILKQFGLV